MWGNHLSQGADSYAETVRKQRADWQMFCCLSHPLTEFCKATQLLLDMHVALLQ